MSCHILRGRGIRRTHKIHGGGLKFGSGVKRLRLGNVLGVLHASRIKIRVRFRVRVRARVRVRVRVRVAIWVRVRVHRTV